MTLQKPANYNEFRSIVSVRFALAILALAVPFSIAWQSGSWPFRINPDSIPAESRSRVQASLAVIAAAPHPTGSPRQAEVRHFITNTLSAYGYAVEVQREQVHATYAPDFHLVGEVQNIMVRLKGRESEKAVLVSAHYDSAPLAPGAADDGYAVASMLEAARLAISGPKPRHDVIFLFTDGEELGLLGAKAFLRHPWRKDVALILNFDSRGSDGPLILFETSGNNRELVRAALRESPSFLGTSMAAEVYKHMPNSTDFSILKGDGIEGLNFANIHGFARYHTPLDSIENVNVNSLERALKTMKTLIDTFAENIPSPSSENVSYFDFLGMQFIWFPTMFGLCLAIFATICGAAIAFRCQGMVQPKAITAILMMIALAVVLSSGVVTAVGSIASAMKPSSPGSHPAGYNHLLWMAGSALIAGAGVTSIAAWSLRSRGIWNSVIAFLLFAGFLTWLATLKFPEAAYLFAIPFALVAAATLLYTAFPRWAALWLVLFVAPPTALSASTAALIFTAAGLPAAPYVTAIISTQFVILIPAVMPMCASGLCACARIAGATGFVLFAAALLPTDPTTAQPAPYSLALLEDLDANRAHVLSLHRGRPGWEARNLQSATAVALQEHLPWRYERGLINTNQMVSSTGPSLRVLTDQTMPDGGRQVSVEVESLRKAAEVYVCFDESNVLSVSVDRSPIHVSAGTRRVTIQRVGSGKFEMTFIVRNDRVPIVIFDCLHSLPPSMAPGPTFIPSRHRNFSGSWFTRRSFIL